VGPCKGTSRGDDFRRAPPVQASTVPMKRGRSADVGASQGALHLATAFPRPVWLDHLPPLLTLREAVTLRATCRDFGAIVADMRADLGARPVKHLKAMLTCFSKAHAIEPYEDDALTEAEQESLIAWLLERGNSLTRVENDYNMGPFIRRAWRAGVFKTVKSVKLRLYEKEERDLLIDGIVSGVEAIGLDISDEAHEVERAALAFLRHFPALKAITCFMGGDDEGLHPCIPPSLETLTLNLERCTRPVLLLGSLPATIESSGAKLRRIELRLYKLDGADTERGVRSLLQACASTLKEVILTVSDTFESSMEVAEGLASCHHLEYLEAPISTFAVMPPGGSTTFRRLATLRLSYCRGDDDRVLSSLALWGLMARGGLPTLTSLHIDFGRWRWGADLGAAVVAAFEGVAGTLTYLSLIQWDFEDAVDGAEADGVLRQFGEAIGKLRRLENLNLRINRPGLDYHRLAQGMAKGACPALHSLTIFLRSGAAWLGGRPSIILPSVQALAVGFTRSASDGAEPLALACALTSLGYRGPVNVLNITRPGEGLWGPMVNGQLLAILAGGGEGSGGLRPS
jgi:hypothetical protein